MGEQHVEQARSGGEHEMVGSGDLDQARLADTLAEIKSYIRRDFTTNSTAHHQGRRGDRLEKVAVVVAGDSFDESHQGVGAGRAAHLGEPLLQGMRLVSADVSEYCGWTPTD